MQKKVSACPVTTLLTYWTSQKHLHFKQLQSIFLLEQCITVNGVACSDKPPEIKMLNPYLFGSPTHSDIFPTNVGPVCACVNLLSSSLFMSFSSLFSCLTSSFTAGSYFQRKSSKKNNTVPCLLRTKLKTDKINSELLNI